MKTTSNFNPISVTVFLVLGAVCAALFLLKIITGPLLAGGLLVSLFIASSIHIADQWEKAVVLRMGKFIGLKGPGPFLIIPIIDKVNNYIDQRVRVNSIKA